MHWNYRIIRKDYKKDGVIIESSYGIHEVYYDKNNRACMVTENSISLYGETISELMEHWVLLSEAFNKPIMLYENIPEPGAINETKETEDDLENIDDLIDEQEVLGPLTSAMLEKYRHEDEELRKVDEEKHISETIYKSWFDVVLELIKTAKDK